MDLVIAILAAVLLTVLLGVTGCRNERPAGSKPSPGFRTRTTRSGTGLDRAALQDRLNQLALAPAPAIQNMGAMCYEMAPPPATANYVCPRCGNKTLYNSAQSAFLDSELQECRDLVREIGLSSVRLDETEFCRTCRPAVTKPALALVLLYDDAATSRVVRNIDANDLRILRGFFEGKEICKDAFDAESPLKDHLDRLETLLGLHAGDPVVREEEPGT